MEKELKILKGWFDWIKLTPNLSKTTFISFGNSLTNSKKEHKQRN